MSNFNAATDRVMVALKDGQSPKGVERVVWAQLVTSEALLVPYRVVLDVPQSLAEWVTMLILTREGDRRCKLSPSRCALAALVYLWKNDTLATGFGVSEPLQQ